MLEIKQRQLNLRTYMYYYKGNIDGIEGKLTKESYKQFQKNNSLKTDGIYGIETELKLLLCVKDIQRLLNKHSYNLVIDGLVDNLTLKAIKDFQKKNSLTVDGIVGNKTYKKLEEFITENNSWNSIKHFKYSEFTCSCGCKSNNIDLNIVKIAEEIRNYFGRAATITSATRCKKHNKTVGGVYNSKYLVGKAIDIYISRITQDTLYAYCKKLVDRGSARYTYKIKNANTVHIDIN